MKKSDAGKGSDFRLVGENYGKNFPTIYNHRFCQRCGAWVKKGKEGMHIGAEPVCKNCARELD